jgi:hypothetical protein
MRRHIGFSAIEISQIHSRKRRTEMDQTTIIRIVSGALFAIVLGILIQRRRTSVK